MARGTQQSQVINYMARYGWITPMVAFQELGITKLATRVSELRKDGFRIRGERVKVKNRFGEEVTVMRYCLDPDAAPRTAAV